MLTLLITLATLTGIAYSSDPTTPQHLRAKSNSTSLAYNGFYFSSYHQGAGFADATLVSNISQALGGAFLNATANVTESQYYLNFNTSISTGASSSIFYHAQISSGGSYDSLSLLTVNLAEAPTSGFSFDDQGKLSWENSTNFAACEWTHAV
jgi:hypothetical protein